MSACGPPAKALAIAEAIADNSFPTDLTFEAITVIDTERLSAVRRDTVAVAALVADLTIPPTRDRPATGIVAARVVLPVLMDTEAAAVVIAETKWLKLRASKAVGVVDDCRAIVIDRTIDERVATEPTSGLDIARTREATEVIVDGASFPVDRARVAIGVVIACADLRKIFVAKTAVAGVVEEVRIKLTARTSVAASVVLPVASFPIDRMRVAALLPPD